ncbi:MAG: GAF domain-containing protein [Anaerolineae bacterium]|nr:GAF domain-containing protein [Anaerolineae bacterium]
MSDTSHSPLNDSRWPSRAVRITLLYILLAALWLLLFDLFFDREALQVETHIVKGVLFVAMTAAGLYLLLSQGARRVRDWSAALQLSQASREAFASASPDLMFELARDGTFLGYQATPMGLNQPAKIFMGRRIQDVLPQIAPQAFEAIERAFATGKLQVFHYQLPLEGTPHEYEARLVTSGADSVIAIVRDVTEQRRTEDALRRAARAFRLLSESNQIIVRADDEIVLLNDICRVAVTGGRFRLAWVGYAQDDDARTLLPVASYGFDDGYLASLGTTWADKPRGNGPSGRAVRFGRPAVIVDCATDPSFEPWRADALQRGYRSVLALPLADDGHVFGVLTVYAEEVDAFRHEEEIALLEELADDLAYGVRSLRTRAEREHARLAEQDQRSLAEALSSTALTLNGSLDLEQVLDCILENIRSVVPHDTASIQLIEGDYLCMARHAGFRERNLDARIDGLRSEYRVQEKYRMMRDTRQPIIIDDTAHSALWKPVEGTEWIRAAVWAPIFDADEFIGVISLDSATPGFFTADHARRLRAFAAQAAIAIRNARLFQAEHEQRSLAEALQDTATIINSALDLEIVTDHILDNLKRVLPHDSASLMLLEDGVGRIVRHRGFEERGLNDWLAGARFPVAEFPTLKQMFDTCEPLTIADTTTYPDWVDSPEVSWIRSYAAAPIHREGRVIGYLQVESAQPDFFSADHTQRLRSFADQAAIALQNAQLYQAAQEHAAAFQAQAQRLALVNRVSALVVRQLDLDAIYYTMLLELQGALGASFSGLILFGEDQIGRLALSTHPDDDANHDITIELEHNASIDYVRATHKPLVSENVLDDPLFEPAWPALRRRGTRSLLIMPLIVGEDVIGTLGLDWVEHRQFAPDELELAEIIANQASIAITNAQLYSAEHDQRVLAEALGHVAALSNRSPMLDDLFDELLENIGRVLTYDAGNIMLFEGDVGKIVRQAGYRTYGSEGKSSALRLTAQEAPHWARMHNDQRPHAYLIADTREDPDWQDLPVSDWIRSSLKAPITIENRVVGVLNLDSATPQHFRSIDAERLQAFADQVALAIQNARLFQAEHDQRTLAEALQAAAAAVSSTLQIDLVLDRILANIGQVLPHDAANIMLIEDGVARVARGYGYAEHGAGVWIGQIRFEADKVPIWQTMLATRQPFALPDTHANSLWLRLPEEEWIRSTVKAPIVLEDHVIGILHLDSEQPGFFDAADAERLQAFADQAAIAIRNAQLYDAIQHHASDLEQRVRERTAQVEAQRTQLQAVLDSMGEAVIFSHNGEVIYVNAAFSALLGYDSTELLHRPFDLIESLLAPAPETERLRSVIRSSLAQNHSWRGTVAARRWDGATVDTALTITQVPGQDGAGDAGLVALFRNISQEKALQVQKDRFIAHASHELRTPLANIKTRLYLLRKQPDKLQSHLEVINHVTDNMTELIENLLDISRFERGVIPLYCRPVALVALIEEVIAIQWPEAERKNILLRASLPDQPLVVNADPQRISQVITNLVNNAINYTSEGGTITIELASADPRDTGSGRQAAIRVRDTGIGIPVEMLPQVFEPFFRANEEVAAGTGLGLTIAREIVHLHHGSITVDSAAGQGAVFTVTLDLLESGQEHNNSATSD